MAGMIPVDQSTPPRTVLPAPAVVDSAINRSATNPADQFQRYIGHSLGYLRQQIVGDSDELPSPKARHLALHLLPLALNVPDIWPVARALLLELAPKMEQSGHRTDWIAILHQSIPQALRHGDLTTVAELYLQSGQLNQLLGNFEDAHVDFSQSYQYFESVSETQGMGRSLGRLAFSASLQQQYADGVAIAQQALTFLPEDDADRASIFSVLGELSRHRHEWQQAIAYHQQAIVIWEASGNLRKTAWGWRDLGIPFCKLGQAEKAIDCYHRSLAIYETIRDPIHQSATQMNLGTAYLGINEPGKALEFYVLAEPVFRQAGDRLRLGSLLTNQGIAYRQLAKYPRAAELFTQSIDLFQQVNHHFYIANAQEELVLVYLALGNHARAKTLFIEALEQLRELDCSPAHQALEDSITERLSQMETGHLPGS